MFGRMRRRYRLAYIFDANRLLLSRLRKCPHLQSREASGKPKRNLQQGVQPEGTVSPGGEIYVMCLAIPAKVIAADEEGRALVEVIGVRRHIDMGSLQDDPPQSGDWVLVHVGFAMSKISEQQALEQLHTLSMLGEDEAVIQEVAGYASDITESYGGP
jgi:hydrogenase expression/formation protein HypC